MYGRVLVLFPNDHKALFKWGTSILEQAKMKLSYSKKSEAELLLESSCSKLNRAIGISQEDYNILYNNASAHLWLATIKMVLQREPEIVNSLLQVACDRFEQAYQIRSWSVDSLRNLAVSLAKKARVSPEKPFALWAKANIYFQKAATLAQELSQTQNYPENSFNSTIPPSFSSLHELYFDWGNALYRQAVTIFNIMHKKAFSLRELPDENLLKYVHLLTEENLLSLLEEASDKYSVAIDILPHFNEAFFNWRMALQCMFSLKSSSLQGQKAFSQVFLLFLLFFFKMITFATC